MAQRFHTDHHELRVDPTVDVIERLAWHYDEPFADSSAVPTWHVAELARRDVTVALTGDGGDELFAGYGRHRAVWLASRIDRLPGFVRAAAGGLAAWLPGGRGPGIARRLKRFSAALRRPLIQRYLDWVGIFDEPNRAALYTDEFVARLPNVDPVEYLARAWRRASRRDAVTAASLADLMTYLPSDLLVKVDIAAMAHGLECRQPLLDHRVVELVAAMPAHYKQRFGHGKRILKAAFADLLPKSVRRRGKMGFGVPLAPWLRNELGPFLRETLLDSAALARGWFRPAAVRRLVQEHQAGTHDHASRLWALLMLELWYRQWGEGSSVSVSTGQADVGRGLTHVQST